MLQTEIAIINRITGLFFENGEYGRPSVRLSCMCTGTSGNRRRELLLAVIGGNQRHVTFPSLPI